MTNSILKIIAIALLIFSVIAFLGGTLLALWLRDYLFQEIAMNGFLGLLFTMLMTLFIR